MELPSSSLVMRGWWGIFFTPQPVTSVDNLRVWTMALVAVQTGWKRGKGGPSLPALTCIVTGCIVLQISSRPVFSFMSLPSFRSLLRSNMPRG